VVTCCSLISALERGGQWQLAEARARAAPGRSRSTPESASLARRPGASGPLLTAGSPSWRSLCYAGQRLLEQRGTSPLSLIPI